MSSSMKDFLDKFFDLCREYQQEIPPQKMAEILREYNLQAKFIQIFLKLE